MPAARKEVWSMKGHLDAEQLKNMNYKSLQALAKNMGVSAAGKAEDIIARVVAVEVDVPEESQLTEEEKAAAKAAQQEEEKATKAAAREQAEAAAEQEAREQAEAAAGLVTVKVITRFLDKQLNQIKDIGETYKVSRERAAELVAAKVVEVVG